MPCAEFEDLILDYCEGAASPSDCALLESHIAACSGCRAYFAEQQELEFRLAKTLPRPALSPEFDSRLAARIAAERRKPEFHWLPRTLDWVGYSSLIAAAAWFIQHTPHAEAWVGMAALAASAGFSLWKTALALRVTYGRRLGVTYGHR